MDIRQEWKSLLTILIVFIAFYAFPVTSERVSGAVIEALALTQWYAREHVILCLIPAMFIAGAIAVFISQASVLKYLGPGANKILAYSVASVSGSILAVCSCTVLPLFAGIYKRGAGLGPATAFLYSGPAINVLAIILTARVLGIELGIARAVGAVIFAIVIGLLMQVIFRGEEISRDGKNVVMPTGGEGRALWKTAVFFFSMVAIMVFATWGNPGNTSGLYYSIYKIKWMLTSVFSILLGIILILWFGVSWWKITGAGIIAAVSIAIFPEHHEIPFSIGIVFLSIVLANSNDETNEWLGQSWTLAKQIFPLLLMGVLVAGALLGRVGHEGLIPSEWVSGAVGGNSLWSNLFASVAGAFMYFATLTEVPIIQGLIDNGMGNGPALALLLAGPALSLPNMLVISSIMGWKKTAVFVSLVIVMATISGIIFGSVMG